MLPPHCQMLWIAFRRGGKGCRTSEQALGLHCRTVLFMYSNYVNHSEIA